ncbi:serine O-acetyltransferase [Geopseudomonas sagittaria]|uniref:Serine O-acetyltransferase n=1 Tax=Geopseudomonas sagittaria TaxID=1135990 RepID=A0A1I5T1M5_9GAMM|nr:transferase [Pseudomonas sagittaria]SFP76356.1 serine O-acetyltransferase [Pseudomonas sagittaria]
MIISPSVEILNKLIRHQIHNLFLLETVEEAVLARSLPEALYKTEKCFGQSKNKYYKKDGEVFFSIYHSGQYCVFLYFLARQVFLESPECRNLADKVYFLNKTLNGLDLYYEIEMPEVFHLDHPVGSVMGRASYGNNFTFSQLCTVGNNKGVFPKIGENVQMLSGSKILGQCVIGDNVIVSANTYIKDTDVPANSLVFGSSPNLVIKQRMS